MPELGAPAEQDVAALKEAFQLFDSDNDGMF